MADQPEVVLEVARGVALLTLRGSGSGVRLSLRLVERLRARLEELADRDDVRAVLLSSEGPDFCRGGPGWRSAAADVDQYRIASSIAALSQPVVVAIHGRAFDQGLEIALAADIRIATSSARFALKQVTKGELPFDGGTQRLPRVVRRGLASEMLLTGREIDAREALRGGLVSEVVEPLELGARAREIAEGVAQRGAAASRFAREAIRRGGDLRLEDGMRLEADLNLLLFHDDERRAGLESFRRRPRRT